MHTGQGVSFCFLYQLFSFSIFKSYLLMSDTNLHDNKVTKFLIELLSLNKYIHIRCLKMLTHNLFVTKKPETTNSPIHEFKVLHKGQRAFQNPFLMVYHFLFITLKNILSLAFSF